MAFEYTPTTAATDGYADTVLTETQKQIEDVEDSLMDQASAKKWKARIEASKRRTEEFVRDWRDNVEYRRGKPFDTASDIDRIAVNPDWPNTKAKQAQLFSQMPGVILTPKLKGIPSLVAAVPVFARELNEAHIKAGTPAAMDECAPDVINAAGVAAVHIRHEKRQVTVSVPAIDRQATTLTDEEWATALEHKLIPMKSVVKGDARLVVERLSPANLIWDKNFRRSDFNLANWVGHRGFLTLAEAEGRGWVKDGEQDKVVGASQQRPTWDKLNDNTSDHEDENDALVEYYEIFYWRYKFHKDEPSFKAIQHVVFVEGKDEPVINEPWKGQQFDPMTGQYVGSCKFPIQFVTLTYLSDESVPPSDTAIGRPQVDELIQSRTDIMLQRRHSRPLRWVNVPMVDPLIIDAIQRGVYEGFIPVNGDGNRAIGEVARAQYPSEDFRFDSIVKDDLREAWQVGSNQLGTATTGETSASEANIVQQNFQTRIGYERNRFGTFFVNITEVLAGLLALYGDFEIPEITPEDKARLGSWDRTKLSTEYVFGIRKDSTVLLDAQQRLDRIRKFKNENAGSGYVNIEELLREEAELSMLDPDKIIKQPQPKGLDPANVSLRISGAQDLQDPMVVAVLSLMGLLPNPQQIKIAQEAIMLANPQGVPTPPPPDVKPPDGEASPQAEQPPNPADGQEGWDMMSRINTRRAPGETGE